MSASPFVRTPKRKAQLADALAARGPMREETRRLIRAARMRQTFPIKMTAIEKSLFDRFTAAGLEFSMHKTMFGRWQPDFVFETARLIVQADGDYWHSRPAAIVNDRRFDEAARGAGWRVLRFLGSEIKAHADQCVLHTIAALSIKDIAA